MDKFELVKENMDKELQKAKLEIAKSESIIEDLKNANDELLSVISVKSNFIQTLQNRSMKEP